MQRKEDKKRKKRSVVQLNGGSECGEVFGIQGLDLRRGPLCRIDMRAAPTSDSSRLTGQLWGSRLERQRRCLLWREGQLFASLAT